MRRFDNVLALSATDLSNFLGCRHRTALDMAVAFGARTRPHFEDPLLDALVERGRDHEQAYVASLAAEGLTIADLSDTIGDRDVVIATTCDAMRDGVAVIVQGALLSEMWFGRPDVMRRVETPSALGPWSYEIVDTKLARETRGGTILQLGLYSEILATEQGLRPEQFHVVTPRAAHRYRVNDYAAYFRLIRRLMEQTVLRDHAEVAAAHYPEPVEHCDICPYRGECKATWRSDDHLSLVANIARLHRRELESRGIATLAGLAQLPLPLAFKPSRGSVETFARVRDQARLQFASRGKAPPPLHELRPVEEGLGLCRLPEPSPGDLFLDLEGDPFVGEIGREYLFGIALLGDDTALTYRRWWAFTDGEERAAFEAVMELIAERMAAYPNMHVYHYAPYEPSAFKRLMGRYAVREQELDAMLRGGRFVDLFAVVRQGMLAGIERYSIKNLEILYGFEREVRLAEAGRCRALVEQALEMGCPDTVPQEIREAVEGYNKDDCVSTLRLRDWLESLRAGLVAGGTAVARPGVRDDAAPESVDERAHRVATLRARLLEGVPEECAARSDEQQARWLLAYMLDWHRREDKAGWWEYYRLCELPEEEELLDEGEAIAGLELVERVHVVLSKKGKPTGSVVDRYQYPVQEMEIDPGDPLKLQDGSAIGTVEQVDRSARTIDIWKGRSRAEVHPTAVFAHRHIAKEVLEEALFAIGEAVVGEVVICSRAGAPDAVARELLLRRPPRLRTGEFVCGDAESVLDFAIRTGCQLDDSVLAIQGPPGSGKTFTGARMILELVARGKRVGVTANSHKVIRNLLDAVAQAAAERGTMVRLAHKTDDDDGAAAVACITSNPDAIQAIHSRDAHVLGGTAWLWARPEFAQSVDVLFVDEAGQMALANVLAVSRAASNVVLLGDPQQLEQPIKGSHPPGVEASALEHLLGGHQTIPPDRGIFLPETWRLSPKLCAFTSEVFYEGRLHSREGLDAQRLSGVPTFEGNGLWVFDTDHDGNRNSSTEEVEVIANLVERLTAAGSRWVNRDGDVAPVTSSDILVVAPYNAQVTRLTERLSASGVQVGTVDKFQGREAPVVIYSMATSRPEDAPRGMEFLYSLNRLNVATSRAKCAAILVASRRLFEPECKTPRQMRLANALCRYRELATVIGVARAEGMPGPAMPAAQPSVSR